MDQCVDLIIVTAKHEEDVSAERAELVVTVEGSSLVTGRAALTKAKEVSKLVEELQRAGVNDSDIGLEGVHAQVSSGILGKSSSATYRLRVRCANLELLPDVLGAVTAAKNARLDEIVWRYPESAEQQAKWLQACVAQTNIKATAAATALGARITGVHRLVEQRLEAPVPVPETLGAAVEAFAARPRAASIQMGFDLTHQKRAGLRVSVEYRVEASSPKSP
jgi:uncharacterized protein YggE